MLMQKSASSWACSQENSTIPAPQPIGESIFFLLFTLPWNLSGIKEILRNLSSVKESVIWSSKVWMFGVTEALCLSQHSLTFYLMKLLLVLQSLRCLFYWHLALYNWDFTLFGKVVVDYYYLKVVVDLCYFFIINLEWQTDSLKW